MTFEIWVRFRKNQRFSRLMNATHLDWMPAYELFNRLVLTKGVSYRLAKRVSRFTRKGEPRTTCRFIASRDYGQE